MSAKVIYTEGQIVGKLIYLGNERSVIEPSGKRKRTVADFKCRCGKKITTRVDTVVANRIVSCGCVITNFKHGHSSHIAVTTEYRIWSGMKDRCNNPESKYYKNYGGRGIKVCDRWNESFENFLADVGQRPINKSLDRYPDNDGNYEPSNFRWATTKEQSDTRRSTKVLTYKNETLPLRIWAEKYKLTTRILWERLYKEKWDIQRAFEQPITVRQYKQSIAI